MTSRLSEKLVRAVEPPGSGNRIHYDGEVKGFGLRVTAQGAKSFVLNYRIRGRERRITIGSYPDWTTAAAREEAKRLKRQVDLGSDPMEVREEDRRTPTVKQLTDMYFKSQRADRSERALADERSMVNKIIVPAIGSKKVTDVRREDIDQLHRDIGRTRPVRANRVAQVLSKMFNMAKRWDYVAANPVEGLKKFPEERRQRYLDQDELQRLSKALCEHANQQSSNAIRLLLLTGARRGEVLGARKNQFDLKQAIWTKPSAHTKQRKEHRVPLSTAAVDLIKKIIKKNEDSPFLFPGKSRDEHQVDLKRSWESICVKAKISNCRIHDLRHTYASILASNGLSLPVIGALLGHTQPSTTARYSHLYDDPLRDATETVGNFLTGS